MRRGLFIVGASGLLGSAWVSWATSYFKVSGSLHSRKIIDTKATFYQLDFASQAQLISVLRGSGSEIVVNCAGMTNVDACQSNENLAFFSNVVLPEKLAAASSALGLKFVHISSDHVFSGKGSMWLENDLPNPINIYARSKLLGEKAVLDAYPSSLVIRTNFFGWGPPYRPSFSDVVINALRSGRKVHLFQDAFFTPLLTEILIEDVHELIELEAVGVYHVSGDDRLSKFDFGLRLAQIFNLDHHLITPSSLSARKDLAPRPLDLSLDNSKLRSSVRYKCRSLATQLNRLRET